MTLMQPSPWDIHLEADELKGRTFILGNKRAFSLSLPAAPGPSPAQLHAHKWFGAYLYGRKFLEGQAVRVRGYRTQLLSGRVQTGFRMGLTSATREFNVEGVPCAETLFVPDGVQGFACTLSGDLEFEVEPEFDLRFSRALNETLDAYQVGPVEDGIVVSNVLPSGSYDDRTETFLTGEGSDAAERLFAVVQVVGDGASVESIPDAWRARRTLFRKDAQRLRFLAFSETEQGAADHAPLWKVSTSQVFVPVRAVLRGGGTLIYGFGASYEEALGQAAMLRQNLAALAEEKAAHAHRILADGHFETGSPGVDAAYAHVLTRLMDALVARQAVAQDTALGGPATMILAGNQYFHDAWKRDENIALGFLLSLGFYEIAREVIGDTWQLQDEVTGRLPQRIRAGEAPPYHSSDGTLWALWRLLQYRRHTGDETLLREKLPMIERFFARSLDRSVDGMLPSGRTTEPDYLWETWMDTPHTPRDGFPVEIQMLWIACLRRFRPILEPVNPDLERRMELAESTAWSALQRFNIRGMPADSLDERLEARDLITPNPYFCFGVGLDLGPEVERSMREMGRRQLAGRQGIRTLAPQDWERVFSAEFLQNRRHVRGRHMRSTGKFNYHRGVEWNWLSLFFVQAELKYGESGVAYRKYLQRQVDAALNRGGIGGMSELFDLSGSRGPEFQAWSMSGFLEALRAFSGVDIDVPERRIVVAPQLPESWPYVQSRHWYGAIPFDVRYSGDGWRRLLIIDFPAGEIPDAEVEIGLFLPHHRALETLELRIDGEAHVPLVHEERRSGSQCVRVGFTVPARRHVEISLVLKRSAGRVRRSA